jgi:hypothetical protein
MCIPTASKENTAFSIKESSKDDLEAAIRRNSLKNQHK